MKKIVAINCIPRTNMNTGTLVREAAKGAESEGAEVQVFDLYRLDKVHGCMSCFACKLAPNEGKCVFKDGLAPVLEAIRGADGLLIGTPNYLGDASAGFRAIYERLIFQSLTYRKDPHRYEVRKIPVLFIMTSNAPKEGEDRARRRERVIWKLTLLYVKQIANGNWLYVSGNSNRGCVST